MTEENTSLSLVDALTAARQMFHEKITLDERCQCVGVYEGEKVNCLINQERSACFYEVAEFIFYRDGEDERDILRARALTIILDNLPTLIKEYCILRDENKMLREALSNGNS